MKPSKIKIISDPMLYSDRAYIVLRLIQNLMRTTLKTLGNQRNTTLFIFSTRQETFVTASCLFGWDFGWDFL